MDGRRLLVAGIVTVSMAAGGVLGAVAFTPRVGEAAADPTSDGVVAASSADGDGLPFDERVRIVGPFGFGVRPLEVAAETIGIPVTELLEALAEGDTIADVAERNGVDPQDVVEAIVAAVHERLEEAVTGLVEGEFPHHPFPGRFGRGFGFAEGPIAAVPDELEVDVEVVAEGF